MPLDLPAGLDPRTVSTLKTLARALRWRARTIAGVAEASGLSASTCKNYLTESGANYAAGVSCFRRVPISDRKHEYELTDLGRRTLLGG